MTRDFNKQNRDDSHSSFRNNSSNRYGEERSPRPPRARLNRETVDRAWENGAPSLHADYRARNSNGQPPRNDWRSNQNASPNAPGGNRTYGTRPNNYRDNSQDSERRSNNGYSNSRPSGTPRPDGDRPRYNGQRSNGNGPSSYRSDGPRYNGYQRSNNNDSAPYNRSSGSRSNGNQYRSGGSRYDNNQSNSTPYGSNSRPGPRPAQGQRPRINKPEGERPRRGVGRDVHPEKEYRPRVNELKPPREPRPPHPRFLSRPEVRRARDAKRYEEYTEQFEGDYEQFDSNDERQPGERSERPARNDYQPRPRNNRRSDGTQRQERHVTPLPDGRVLKGSRPLQRQNAEFWTNINNDTEALVGPVQANEAVSAEAPVEEDIQSDGERPQSTEPTSRTTKSRKDGSGETTKKPRSNGPKPSQKGHKWPTS